MRAKITSTGHILLPVSMRRRDALEPGQQFEIERIQTGEYRLTRISATKKSGLLQLLRACPVKGWFQPLPRTETTADVAAFDSE